MSDIFSTETKQNQKWVRVSRSNPCPVCGKPDWCLISQDGKSAICARVESNRPAGNKGAGWLHSVQGYSPLRPLPRASLSAIRQTPKAPPAILDSTYQALLAKLPLFKVHHENLRHRGLTDAQITSLGYRTLPPNGRYELVAGLQSNEKIRLNGVPGFYPKDGNWYLAGPVGIAIPVKDIKRRIVGLQVRCDKAEGGRYKWVSSRGFNAGCSPGAPVHVAGAATPCGEIWITEGPIKADIAALRLGYTVLAVPGVGNWLGVIPIIRELRPARIIVAFDMDKNSNPSVRLHSDALMAYLIRSGMRTFETDWDSSFKGLDDLLIADGLP